MATNPFADGKTMTRQVHRRFSAPVSRSKQNHDVLPEPTKRTGTSSSPFFASDLSQFQHDRQNQWNCSWSYFPANFGNGSVDSSNDDLDRSLLHSSSGRSATVEIHEDDRLESVLDVTRSKFFVPRKVGGVSVSSGSS
jgi:hypothetical protein